MMVDFSDAVWQWKCSCTTGKQSLIQSDQINNAVNAVAFTVMTAAVKMIQPGGRGMYSSLV